MEISCLSLNIVIWFYQSMSTEPIYRFNPLILNPIKIEDHGYYYCYGVYENRKHFIARITVKVIGKCLYPNYNRLIYTAK